MNHMNWRVCAKLEDDETYNDKCLIGYTNESWIRDFACSILNLILKYWFKISRFYFIIVRDDLKKKCIKIKNYI